MFYDFKEVGVKNTPPPLYHVRLVEKRFRPCGNLNYLFKL